MRYAQWLILVVVSAISANAQNLSKPKTHPKVRIALVDSGIDTKNRMLMRKVWRNPNEKPNNNIDDDHNGCIDDTRGCNVFNISNDVDDYRGHGTYVSAVYATRSSLTSKYRNKISKDIKIIPVRAMAATWYPILRDHQTVSVILDSLKVTGSAETIIKAIDYLIAIRRRTGDNIVFSGSFTFNDLPENKDLVDEAFRKAERAGLLMVMSAGNNGDNTELAYPASLRLSNMITVGATDGQRFAKYSCKGADIAAEGSNVPDLGKGYERLMTGTSFAGPNVGLAAAQIWENHPDWTAERVIAAIIETADTKAYLNEKVRGSRLLNFDKAIAK